MDMIFGVWDWVIMAATMAGSIGIGLYFRFSGGRQKTNEEYLLADRNMSILPVAVSLMASFVSAITLLGVSSENYYYGMQFAVINISHGIATPIITKLYLPVFFGLQKISTYEYLELRFGPRLRMIASLTYTLQMSLYNGIVLYAPAIVLEAVTGLDRRVSVLVVGIACTFYATLGGMKAVVFTDLLQSSLMFAAVLMVVIYGSVQLGGIGAVFHIAREGGRLDFSNFSVDPTERNTWWSLLIGGMFTYLSLYAVNQTQVQRLLTVSTLERSSWCLWLSYPVMTVMNIIICTSGITIYAMYKDCDPIAAGQINAMDQLLPYFVVDTMRSYPGLSGLFVAGIFSATLSTASSACNSLAAVTLSDYVSRWYTLKPSITNLVAKLIACAYGLLFLGLAFLAEQLGGLLQASMTIFGAVGGPLLGAFSLGMFTTFANEGGVSIALLSGMAATLWMGFGGPRPAPVRLPVSVEGCAGNVTYTPVVTDPTEYFYLYRLSYLWTSPIGFLWVMVVGAIISLLWRQQQPWERNGLSSPDPGLFTPLLAARLKRVQSEKDAVQSS